MKQFQDSRLGARARSIIAKLNAILKKNYSFVDFNLDKAKRVLNFSRYSVFRQDSSALVKVDREKLIKSFIRLMTQERIRLIYLASIFTVIFIGVAVLIPHARVLTDRLSLRPAQWAHLQNLIMSSQARAISATPPLQFDDVQLQGLRSMFLSRDIKPLTLVISSRSPVKLEIKANNVPFSAFLDVLEQMRIQWNLYPDELDIQATELPAVVSIKGFFLQHRSLDIPNAIGGERR